MPTEPRSNATPAVIGTLILLGTVILVYVAGYYLLDDPLPVAKVFVVNAPLDEAEGEVVGLVRIYPYSWLAEVYRPMAALEGSWRGIWVDTVGPDRIGFDFEFDVETEPAFNGHAE